MNSFASGIAGFFLFLGNWLSPHEKGELFLNSYLSEDSLYTVECRMAFRWSDDATPIVDAGIPLLVRVIVYVDGEKSDEYIRVLRGEIVDESYAVYDSLSSQNIEVIKSNNIYVALKRFKHLYIQTKDPFKTVAVEMVVEKSPVPSLNRVVDLSKLLGASNFSAKIKFEEK